jgi:hypothetical protein
MVIWVVMLCELVESLKMKAVCSSETLVTIYKSTWHHNPEDHHLHLHHHENLKFHKMFLHSLI